MRPLGIEAFAVAQLLAVRHPALRAQRQQPHPVCRVTVRLLVGECHRGVECCFYFPVRADLTLGGLAMRFESFRVSIHTRPFLLAGPFHLP